MIDSEYFEALRRLNTLLHQGHEPNSPEASEIQALQLAIDLYELEMFVEPVDSDQPVC